MESSYSDHLKAVTLRRKPRLRLAQPRSPLRTRDCRFARVKAEIPPSLFARGRFPSSISPEDSSPPFEVFECVREGQICRIINSLSEQMRSSEKIEE